MNQSRPTSRQTAIITNRAEILSKVVRNGFAASRVIAIVASIAVYQLYHCIALMTESTFWS